MGFRFGSNPNPNPKTQKNQTPNPNPNSKTKRNQVPNPNQKTQKFLGFKNILFILRYFNEYIFSDFFLNPNIFGFLGFGLGLELGFFVSWVWI
jgi:hypothetical protein